MPITEVESTPPISIALGVVLRDGQVLVGWRDSKLPQGAYWEFPGGKVESHETPQQAVVRELKEEIGITIQTTNAQPLISFAWHYGVQRYFFDVYVIKDYDGEPSFHFYRHLKWQAVSELQASDFPPANGVIIKALLLPNRYLITPAGLNITALSRGLSTAFQSGMSLAVFRSPELDSRDYIDSAKILLSQNPNFSARLLIHNQPAHVDMLNAAGVQLSAAQAKKYCSRPLSSEKLLAISCHHQAELEYACRLDADFALLGPIRATLSHPEHSGMGWEQFRTLVKAVPIPVYAIGGLDAGDLSYSHLHGAQGIAAIRGLWQ